jgi:hypothetical protein
LHINLKDGLVQNRLDGPDILLGFIGECTALRSLNLLFSPAILFSFQ